MVTGPTLCLQSSEHACLSNTVSVVCLRCTPLNRRGRTIYHWHDMVQSQALTTLLSKAALTCVKHLKTPKLGVNWCTGHSRWDRNQLEKLWIKASAHWNYKQCCVLNQQDLQIQPAMSASHDLHSLRYNNTFMFTLSSTINMQGFVFEEGTKWLNIVCLLLDLLWDPDIIYLNWGICVCSSQTVLGFLVIPVWREEGTLWSLRPSRKLQQRHWSSEQ